MVNSLNRKKKRMEIRKHSSDFPKEKEKKSTSFKKPKWRKLSSGEYAYGGVKFSKVGIGICVTMLAIVAMFAIAHYNSEWFLIETETMSFEECELNDFNNSICLLNYKFCRTYADGTSLCQFAETNPFVSVDPNEKKYTAEEQDFLPPTMILPFFQQAYGAEPDPNKAVQDLRNEIQKLQDEIIEMEKKTNDWNIEEPKLMNEKNSYKRELEDAEDNFEEMKTAYRHAMDIKPRNKDDIKIQTDALKDYKDSLTKLSKAEKEYTDAVDKYDKSYNSYLDNKSNAQVLNDKLKELLDELTFTRINANIVHKTNKFISIVLSDSCKRAIENNVNKNCPTYKELVKLFDNTMPEISGEFIEDGNDIRRVDPKYKNYWNYYNQIESWKIITVDPDAEMMKRSSVITIQPSSFTYFENIASQDKTKSIDNIDHERYVWKDVKYNQRCSEAMVAPDMELITETINFLLDGCDGELEIIDTIDIPQTEYNPFDSYHYMYAKWMEDIKVKCKVKC